MRIILNQMKHLYVADSINNEIMYKGEGEGEGVSLACHDPDFDSC